jgi:type I restriction enzyme S subunit
VRDSDEVVTCFRDGTVTLRKNRRLRGYTEATVEHGYQGIRKGDLVIHAMDAFAGAAGVADSDGKGTPVYSVCQPRLGVSANYFAHAVRVMARTKWILALAKGIRERSTDFRFDAFGAQRLPVPSKAEQAAIVRFLDHVGGRIERAIRAKRRVIALLQEQKQAIIHRAVTRGVDGAATSNVAGVPWLGAVPEHWQVQPFVRCAIERADYRGATPEKVEAGVFLVTARNIKRGWIDYACSREFVRAFDYARIMRRGLPKIGDVLLTTEAPLGHVACVDREDVAIAQRVIRFRMAPEQMLPTFALLCLNDRYFQCQLAERATGSTAQGIKASKLPQLQVAVPPIAEQERIVRFVQRETEPLLRVVGRGAREIDLLQEYRTRLTADVVTGKLDVREAAAKLPDEPRDIDEPVSDLTDEPVDEEVLVE